MTRPTRGMVAAAFLVLYLVWGSTYLAIRFAVETIPPFLMAGTRFLVAGLGMLLWARFRGTPWPRGRQWLGALALGTCFVVLSNALVVLVEQWIASGVVALFAAASPLLIALFNRRRLGTPLAPVQGAGLLLGTVGLVLLGGATFAVVPDPLPLVLLAVAIVSWSIGATWGRDWPQAPDIVAGSGAQMLAGGAAAIVVGLLLGEHRTFDPAAVSTLSVAGWAYLTVFGSMLAFTAFQWLMAHVDATAVASYTYINPIVALLLGAAVADERLTSRTLFATGLLVPAVALTIVGGKAKRS